MISHNLDGRIRHLRGLVLNDTATFGHTSGWVNTDGGEDDVTRNLEVILEILPACRIRDALHKYPRSSEVIAKVLFVVEFLPPLIVPSSPLLLALSWPRILSPVAIGFSTIVVSLEISVFVHPTRSGKIITGLS